MSALSGIDIALWDLKGEWYLHVAARMRRLWLTLTCV